MGVPRGAYSACHLLRINIVHDKCTHRFSQTILLRFCPPYYAPPEVKRQFLERFGDSSLTVASGGLQGKSANLLKALLDECVAVPGLRGDQ